MKKGFVIAVALLLLPMMLFANGDEEQQVLETETAQPVAAPAAAVKKIESFEGNFTYNDSVGQMPTNWNPHTYQTTDDAYPADQGIRLGLYSFIFNDELHPVEGKEPYSGYKIIPEMAAELPIDITEEVKAEHPEFNIPESAHTGFAYKIILNPKACWENGDLITADTYVESFRRLFDPRLLNYRATDWCGSNDLSIAGAELYSNQGQKKVVPLRQAIQRYGVDSLQALFDKCGDMTGYINWANSFGVEYDFAAFPFPENAATLDAATIRPTDEVKATPLTLKDLGKFYIDFNLVLQDVGEEQSIDWMYDELFVEYQYPEGATFDTVGVYATGEYELVFVFDKALEGFQLLYNLGGVSVVHPQLYDANLTEKEGVWTSTYNTSVDTTLSYGPYKLVSYQADKAMRFEKNDKWYGWYDGKHIYVDPEDGKTYPMYQTTAIDTLKVEEASTRKLMFLKGQLATYGLQKEDFEQYRSSDYCYVVPSETIFFLILNGYKDAIENREAAADFDKANVDLETMLLPSFRKAVAVTYDKELFASTVSPARSGAYGIIGTKYIYDPDTGARYRDTVQAKQVLCDFYSVDVSKFDNLDDAVASITGYDPEAGKVLYGEAFKEAIQAGYITDADNDGISDQTVTIEYCLSADSPFMTTTVDYLNEKMAEVTAGTPFEGRVKFVKSAPYGNEWANKIKSGLSDTVLGGWQGSMLNPFGLTELYTNPAYQYDGKWFDSTQVKLTLTVPVDGADTELTMSLQAWSNALNGTTVTVNDKEYNFGVGQTDIETRLTILAAIEGEVLKTYDYLPMLQNAGMHLLSQKMYYVVEEYNAIMGRGGVQYLKYNYTDEEWDAYVSSQGGELKY